MLSMRIGQNDIIQEITPVRPSSGYFYQRDTSQPEVPPEKSSAPVKAQSTEGVSVDTSKAIFIAQSIYEGVGRYSPGPSGTTFRPQVFED